MIETLEKLFWQRTGKKEDITLVTEEGQLVFAILFHSYWIISKIS